MECTSLAIQNWSTFVLYDFVLFILWWTIVICGLWLTQNLYDSCRTFWTCFFMDIFKPISPVENLVLTMLWHHPKNIEFEKVKVVTRGVHGSGRVGFGPKPNSTRLNRFPEFGIRIRPNIGSDPIYRVIGLSGSESSVSRVWASDWAGLFDRVKIIENTYFWAFLLNLFSNRASSLTKLDLLGHQSRQIKRPK